MKTTSRIVLFLLSTALGWSQAVTGSISGSVTDSSGAAIQNADLSVVSVTTGAERKAKSNQSGGFVISALDPGQYSLTLKASGFKTLERKDISLTPSERLSLGALTLEVGTTDQRITVSAEGTTVQTESAERSAEITNSQTEGLPVYGRAVTSLVAIAPGVVDPIGPASRSPGGGNYTDFNVAGNRATHNNFSVDGITLTALGGAPNGTFGVSMEAVSEVKVLISNYQAEYGRLAGSNVEMVTKSGTREFHGMGMYYMRNEALNANNFFNNLRGISRPVNRFNAVTYNVGGPVLLPHNIAHVNGKLFFFFNQEYLPQNITGALQYSTMPTALERDGDFSQSYVGGKLVTITDPTTGQPFPGNVIPQSRLDANGQALLKVLPLPNVANPGGAYNYVTAFTSHAPLQMDTLKLDYNVTSNDSVSVSLNGDWSSTTAPNGGGISAPFAIVPTISSGWSPMISIHYTHIFSPTTVNELTAGYAGTGGPTSFPSGLQSIQRTTYGFAAGQLNPANNPLDLIPGMSFGGVSDAPSVSYDGRFPYYLTRYATDISDNLSKVIGTHSLKIGIFLEHLRQYDGRWASNFTGTLDFGTNANNPLNTGNPYANADLGVFNSYTEATSHPISLIYSNGVDGFVQDNWKVNKKLTLDYGVRFSWYQPFYNYNNEMAGFVPSLYNPSQAVKLIQPGLSNGNYVGVNPITGQTYSSALIGFIAPGSGNLTNGMVVAAQDRSYPRALINDMGPLIAPRFGFAYDPFGDGKTAIRGGFGVFYSRPLGWSASSGAVYSYPIVQSPVVQFGTLSTFTSAQGFISPPSVVAWQKDWKAPTVTNMSFTIQRNIGFGTVVDIGYVGSLDRHLSWQENLEPIPLGAQFLASNANPVKPNLPLPNAFLVPIQGYSGIAYYADDATSNYHSLQVTANRRFAHGVQFGFAWTWSKAMDWTDGDFGAVNNAVPTSLFRAWNYGLAGFDRTHVVKINWLWDVPTWKSTIAPVRAVVNGWHIYGIATFSSGAPLGVGFSQVTATNITGTPSVGARIDVIGNPNSLGRSYGSLQAFNPAAFALPAVGTLGDPSKVLIRGPGLNNWDISLVRSFGIWERLNMQFRAELYNAFNHTQFSSINTTALFNAAGDQVNSQFGQYTAAQNPRIIQLAVRLQF